MIGIQSRYSVTRAYQTLKVIAAVCIGIYVAGSLVIFGWTERQVLSDTLRVRVYRYDVDFQSANQKRHGLLLNSSPVLLEQPVHTGTSVDTPTTQRYKPRKICLSEIQTKESCTKAQRHRIKDRSISYHTKSQRRSKSERNKRDEPEVDQPDQSVCVPTEPWQTTHHSSCNIFHEIYVRNALVASNTRDENTTNAFVVNTDREDTTIEYIASGGWRGVWRLSQGDPHQRPLALKMMKWTRKKFRTYTQGTYRRHIVDAVISDRVSGLGIATDIYGFCGLSTLYPFGDAHLLRTIKALGDVDREQGFQLDWKSNDTLTARVLNSRGMAFDNNTYGEEHRPSPGNGTILKSWPTLRQRIMYARDAAVVVANMRSIDWHGGNMFNVTIVHHDLKPDNFIILPDGGGLRLNDFNDATLLWYNTTSSGPCLFRCRKHNPHYQSPEEAWELPLSHAVDLHTLGGVVYFILFGKMPYWDLDPSFAFAYLSKEVFPLLPVGFNIQDSGNRAVTTMLQLMQRLRSIHPAQRPPASDVVAELDALLEI